MHSAPSKNSWGAIPVMWPNVDDRPGRFFWPASHHKKIHISFQRRFLQGNFKHLRFTFDFSDQLVGLDDVVDGGLWNLQNKKPASA